ncbi:hypothetical protein M422DRAFT_778339 [Sphaerobolus stellatus SS14]|uniref:Uncharacterized protein n=1 Tax=Sphaerobolus stellatus (strain SS14) TaxID=990650 RepID=A0A0C9VV55_SPHS4|nr:hypothetical protein M422DRAFT_778339 [Sphaerobolus stellatus SS14]
MKVIAAFEFPHSPFQTSFYVLLKTKLLLYDEDSHPIQELVTASWTRTKRLFGLLRNRLAWMRFDSFSQLAGRSARGAELTELYRMDELKVNLENDHPDLTPTQATLWILETSTDPEVLSAAVGMISYVEWPRYLDYSKVRTWLLDRMDSLTRTGDIYNALMCRKGYELLVWKDLEESERLRPLEYSDIKPISHISSKTPLPIPWINIVLIFVRMKIVSTLTGWHKCISIYICLCLECDASVAANALLAVSVYCDVDIQGQDLSKLIKKDHLRSINKAIFHRGIYHIFSDCPWGEELEFLYFLSTWSRLIIRENLEPNFDNGTTWCLRLAYIFLFDNNVPEDIKASLIWFLATMVLTLNASTMWNTNQLLASKLEETAKSLTTESTGSYLMALCDSMDETIVADALILLGSLDWTTASHELLTRYIKMLLQKINLFGNAAYPALFAFAKLPHCLVTTTNHWRTGEADLVSGSSGYDIFPIPNALELLLSWEFSGYLIETLRVTLTKLEEKADFPLDIFRWLGPRNYHIVVYAKVAQKLFEVEDDHPWFLKNKRFLMHILNETSHPSWNQPSNYSQQNVYGVLQYPIEYIRLVNSIVSSSPMDAEGLTNVMSTFCYLIACWSSWTSAYWSCMRSQGYIFAETLARENLVRETLVKLTSRTVAFCNTSQLQTGTHISAQGDLIFNIYSALKILLPTLERICYEQSTLSGGFEDEEDPFIALQFVALPALCKLLPLPRLSLSQDFRIHTREGSIFVKQ